MKVAQLIPYFFSGVGGLEVCVHNISTELTKLGLDVSVIHSDEPPSGFKSCYRLIRKKNLRILPNTFALNKTWILPYIRYIQKTYGFDIWQVNGGYPYGAILANFFLKHKIPSALRCSGEDVQINDELGYGLRRNPKIDNRVKSGYPKYNALIAITETVKQEYLEIGCHTSKIHIIPNGVNIDNFENREIKKDIRTRHSIPADARIILSTGRNHAKKGYEFAPQILQAVRDKGINAYWIIIGKHTLRLKSLWKDKEISKRIICIEEISHDSNTYDIPAGELIDYYKSADVFAMTSLLETFGIVLIEAMAAGLGVVCFDVPGVRDVVPRNLGKVCQPKNLKEFSDALVSILKNNISLERNRNIEYAKRFDWELIARKYKQVYEQIRHEKI